MIWLDHKQRDDVYAAQDEVRESLLEVVPIYLYQVVLHVHRSVEWVNAGYQWQRLQVHHDSVRPSDFASMSKEEQGQLDILKFFLAHVGERAS